MGFWGMVKSTRKISPALFVLIALLVIFAPATSRAERTLPLDRLDEPTAVTAPYGLAQMNTDFSPLAVNANATSTTVLLTGYSQRCAISGFNFYYALEFEVRSVYESFTGVPTHSSSTVGGPSSGCDPTQMPVTGVSVAHGQNYKWQVRERQYYSYSYVCDYYCNPYYCYPIYCQRNTSIESGWVPFYYYGAPAFWGPNAAPVAANDSYTINEDSVLIATQSGQRLFDNDSDADGDALTFNSLQTVTANGGSVSVINSSTGAFTYRPRMGYSGVDTFTYSIRDNYSGVSNTATVSITVNPALIVTNTDDSGPGSLRQVMVDVPAGHKIKFAAGLSGTIALTTGQLVIDKSMEIDGPGAGVITVSGNDASRVFFVNPGVTVTIDGLTIADGQLPDGQDGAGIYNDGGTLNLTWVNLLDNDAGSGGTASGGGGLYSQNSGVVTISDSTLSGNASGKGGGIYNQADGTLTITSSTVSGNTANGSGGGGIYNNGALIITDSSISNNSVPGGGGNCCDKGGGGIFNNHTLTVIGTTISSNTTDSFGAGILSWDGTLIVEDSTLSDNDAAQNAGGLYVYWGTVEITNSVFSGNSVTNLYGGGASIDHGSGTITGSTFSGNSANQGGGIYDAGPGTLTITNSTFTGNTAAATGGGLQTQAGTNANVTIIHSTFSENTASNGGSIYNTGTVTLRNTIVANSTSGGNCAGSTITNGGNNLQYPGTTCGATIQTADPLLEPLADNGGWTQTHSLAFFSPAIDAAGACGLLTDQRDQYRDAKCDTGAYEYQYPHTPLTITVDTCDTAQLVIAIQRANTNHADDVIELNSACTYTLTAVNNTNGGANGLPSIEAVSTAGTLIINGNHATIQRDPAAPDFRILHVATGGNLTLDDVIIQNGREINGGGIYSQGTLTLLNSTISNNTASNNGGGIYNNGTSLTIHDSTIEGNTAKDGGGIRSVSSAEILNSTIHNNTASAGSGGIGTSGGTLTITGSYITNNSAPMAGGLQIHSPAIVNIDSSTLSGNTAAMNGGGILNNGGTLYLTQVTVQNNDADYGGDQGEGGGIYSAASGSVMVITDSLFSGNRAGLGAGAVHSYYGTLTITNSTFQDNAAFGGGAIKSASTTTISDSIFSGNHAYSGTVVVLNATISNNTFSNNANFAGGGLSILGGGTITLTNNTFSGNSVTYGGAIYNDMSTAVTLINNTITANTASSEGGGIYNVGGTFNIRNSIVTGNTAPTAPNISGSFNNQGNNLLSGEPLLRALADNGGPTQTMLPGLGSPAVDAIPQGTNGCGTTITADQRGETRPFDGTGDGVAACDIGAVELQTSGPGFTIDDVSSVEGDSGTTVFTFTVTRSGFTDMTNTVQFATADQTATAAGNDYVAASGTLTFDPGEITQSFDVVVNGDLAAEQHETFAVNLSNAVNAWINDSQGVGTITNDDAFIVTNLNDSGAGSLRQVISEVPVGGVVRFVEGLNGTIPLSSELVINKNLTIDGPGMNVITVSGQNTVRVFKVNAGFTVTIDELTVANGLVTDVVTYWGGAGLYNGGSDITLNRVAFRNNYVWNDAGAVLNYSGTLTVNDCVFENNHAYYGGGAIGNWRGSTVTITGSTFTNNYTEHFQSMGGALWTDSSGNMLETLMTVTNSTFTGNHAASGGAISGFRNSIIAITDSTITNNAADVNGGAIYSGTDDINHTSTVTITGGEISGNTAGNHGGAIYDNQGTVTVNQVTFATNQADVEGGAIAVFQGSLTVDHSTFTGNNACTGDSGGGAIYLHSNVTTASILSSIFTANCGFNEGGAITAEVTDLLIDSSQFTNNTVTGHRGGAVSSASGYLTVVNSTFTGNSAIDAGAIYASGLSLTDSTISGNSVTSNGGGLYVVGPVEITGGEISGNTVGNGGRGAGIYNTGTLTLTAVTITGNTAPGGGDGGALWNDGSAAINTSTLSNNTATDAGGAIVNNATLNITDSTITGNTTTDAGGGIYNVASGNLTISDSTLSDNHVTAAMGKGGGIYNTASLTITGGDISGNTSNNTGGGIQNFGTVTITGATFSGNSAETGAGLNTVSGTVTIIDSTFSSNTSTAYGGGIAVDNSTIDITGSTFVGNSASLKGGGLYKGSGVVTITNSTFYQNSATAGGGVRTEVGGSGSVTITNSTLYNNTSTGGNGHNIFNETTVTLQNSIVANDQYVENCYGTITNGGGNLEYLSWTCGGTVSTNDPLLGPLQDNGGPTLTMLPGLGSPAVDKAVPANCPTKDQRGVDRPFDGDADNTPTCDIGAVERDIPAVKLYIEGASITEGDSGTQILSFPVTLSGPAPSGGVTFKVSTNDGVQAFADEDFVGIVDEVYSIPEGSSGLTIDVTVMGDTTYEWDEDFWISIYDVVGALYGDFSGTGTIYNDDPYTICSRAGLIDAFNAEVTPIDLTGCGTISLYPNMSWSVYYDLVINGGGTILDGNSIGNFFFVRYGHSLTLNDLTLQHSSGGYGGAIQGDGGDTIILNRVTISDSRGYEGGAILSGGTLIINDSTITGTSARRGGAIQSYGITTITNSTITDSSAFWTQGGAIYNIYNGTIPNHLTLINSTISNSSAVSGGSGIYNIGNLTLRNSLIANSTNGPNCETSSTVTFEGVNLIEDGSCGIRPGVDLSGDPLLDPLADNGGPTQTMLPTRDSPLIDAGDDATCAPQDQRGEDRPKDGDGDGNATCDIGAVEADYTPPPCLDPASIMTADDLTGCIIWANTNPGADTLTLAADITLNMALPNATSEITINGNGHAVSGDNAVRVFYVASTGNLTLNTITVQDGHADYGGGIYNSGTLTVMNSSALNNEAMYSGGGIYNQAGTVTVTTSTISDNSAISNDAGGIHNQGGTMVVTDSIFSNNTANTSGGIYNGGTLTVTRCTFTGNTTTSYGGGIYNSASLTVLDSTFTENSANWAGAIYQHMGMTTVIRSTLFNNSASSGGGIQTYTGTAIVTNSTISGNTAHWGGGIRVDAESTLILTNSTLSENSGTSRGGAIYASDGRTYVYLAGNVIKVGASGLNCVFYGTVSNNGYNLSDDNSCAFSGTSVNNAALNLGPLANNGGPTRTHLPGAGSAAIDRLPAGITITNGSVSYTCGQNGEALDSDQRGEPRPAAAGGRCDAGAVEAADVPLTLGISDVSVTEGDSGTVNAEFTVTLNAANHVPVTVQYATADSTATAGSDYTATSGTLTFDPDGALTRTISVPVVGDTLDEIDETFTVTLSNITNATLTDTIGVGTLIDDDNLAALSINDVSINEGDSGTVNAVFTVALNAASGKTVTVQYATANVTALSGSDYTATSGTLTFTPGVTTQPLTVPVTGDVLDEFDETFTVTLSSPVNAASGDMSGTGTIIDNDPTPTLSINDVTVTEGNAGTTNATFTVTLSAASGKTVTVQYATANVTALSGSDYTATSGTLTFTPGVTTQPLTVPVTGDTLCESNETFTVVLSGPTNAEPGDVSGTGTIADDDLCAPVLLTPPDRALTNDNTPTFTWQPVPGAVMYRIQVENAPVFTVTPLIDAVVNDTTYTLMVPLDDNVTYSWRVAALDSLAQSSPWSDVWTFTIDPLRLAAPGLNSPKDHTYTKDTTPTFTWKTVKGAVNYQFQLSEDYDFGGTLENTQTLTAQSYTLPVGHELDYGIYFWRVRAQDVFGYWSDWSYTNTVTITLLSSPKNATHLTDTTPTLSWQSAGIGAQYEVQVDRIGGAFSTPVFTYSGTAKSIASTELAGGDYQWRARSNAGGGWSVWTPVWTFTITPPTTTAPALISPANNANLNTTTPEFEWSPVPNGASYQIQISVNSSFSTPVQDMTLDPGDLNYTASALINGGKYYWRVRAINAEGVAGAWSAKWQFTLNQLAAPVLLAPVTGTPMADTTPDLSWNLTAGAVSYEIQIDTTNKFSSPDQFLTAAGTMTTATPLPDGKYYWRVRAVNAFDVTGLWSAVWNFTVDTTGPDQPVLNSPKDFAGTGDTTPTLAWKSAKTAQQYRLQVAKDVNFTQIEIDVTVGGTSYTVPTADALDYGVHYWRVKAADALGNWGEWSAPFQFALTTMTSPKDGTATTSARPTFAWAAVAGAVAYHFELADNPGFNVPLVTEYTGLNRSYVPPVPGLTAGMYYWHVQIDTGTGYGDWMPTWTLVITPVKPGKPALSSPANKALTNDNTPTFDWLATTNGNTYQIQIDNNTDFSSPEQDVTVGVGLLSYVADELPDAKYYWRVRAFNSDGASGAWSAKWQLTIDTTAPPLPEMLAPIDGAVSTNQMLKLTWSKVDGANVYELRLDPDETFPLPVISGGNKTTYTPPTPLSRGVYWWQVRALDKAGNASEWTTARSFEIVAGVTAPIIETPTPVPTAEPTIEPTVEPTTEPIIITPEATIEPTVEPTVEPPAPLDNLLPTMTLPVSETFATKGGWQARGVWKFGKKAGIESGGWFADSSRRGVTSVLIAPVLIDLTGAQAPMLYFWQQMGLSSGDLAAVDVSLDGGQTWQPLDQQRGHNAQWGEYAVDLSAYRGQVLRLRFRLETQGRVPQGEQSRGWGIDNISVQESVLTP